MVETIPLRIDIVSDVVCPWCIIGYKQVEKALTMLDQPVEASIWWHPFELNPGMSSEGQDVTEHLAQKYGATPEQSKANRQRIGELGAGLGFEFGRHDNRRIYNTFKAHKMLRRVAEEKGWREQTALKLALFAAYFQNNRDVSNDEVLLDVAESTGLEQEAVVGWLADETLSEEVRSELAHWRENNITGVPAIIIDQRFMIPGAQDAQTFADWIGKILVKRAEAVAEAHAAT
ncbi:MAG: DsbA family oxidoreductase [Sphingomonadaceae bacterium]|nr:DsbA family oxidoreductase [Sphingomonadaceae bacterium]